MNKLEKIAVLMGGVSSEREVSLESGRNVVEALASTGRYDVVGVDLAEESLAALPGGVSRAYIALHGGWGENGGVQAALDARGIPYTGPGAMSSQIAMDKVKTKMVLELKGLPTAAWSVVAPGTESSPLPLPVVVKPPCDGSSIGISKVSSAGEWKAALDAAFAAASGSPTVLVEDFVPGREMTVGVIEGTPLPVVEIVAKGGWYGYDEKYRSDETKYPFYGDADSPVLPACPPERLQKVAVEAFDALGCRGVARVDFRVSPVGRCSILELNTSPGLTAHSLVPKAAARAGMAFPELCERILAAARFDARP